jgi:hypothetical protein
MEIMVLFLQEFSGDKFLVEMKNEKKNNKKY